MRAMSIPNSAANNPIDANYVTQDLFHPEREGTKPGPVRAVSFVNALNEAHTAAKVTKVINWLMSSKVTTTHSGMKAFQERVNKSIKQNLLLSVEDQRYIANLLFTHGDTLK